MWRRTSFSWRRSRGRTRSRWPSCRPPTRAGPSSLRHSCAVSLMSSSCTRATPSRSASTSRWWSPLPRRAHTSTSSPRSRPTRTWSPVPLRWCRACASTLTSVSRWRRPPCRPLRRTRSGSTRTATRDSRASRRASSRSSTVTRIPAWTTATRRGMRPSAATMCARWNSSSPSLRRGRLGRPGPRLSSERLQRRVSLSGAKRVCHATRDVCFA
mmetsp:Transcript_48960/g.127801  ORF Transcript_48960/g.127801 Transcript_48960/m.127801 type:complete len:213 (+) Transcript_48960:251-889(+)